MAGDKESPVKRRTRVTILSENLVEMQMGDVLLREFYARSAADVARELLGQVLVHGSLTGKIVETEAYLGLGDRAAHAFRGEKPRTKVIFGEPGHAYVYFIYGMHECLNAVAGDAGCVLIRALEPVSGIPSMQKLRGREPLKDLTSGPGKLTVAMGITRKLNGADLTSGELVIQRGDGRRLEVGVGPRVGIRECADWPLRFWIKGNTFVSGSANR